MEKRAFRRIEILPVFCPHSNNLKFGLSFLVRSIIVSIFDL